MLVLHENKGKGPFPQPEGLQVSFFKVPLLLEAPSAVVPRCGGDPLFVCLQSQKPLIWETPICLPSPPPPTRDLKGGEPLEGPGALTKCVGISLLELVPFLKRERSCWRPYAKMHAFEGPSIIEPIKGTGTPSAFAFIPTNRFVRPPLVPAKS